MDVGSVIARLKADPKRRLPPWLNSHPPSSAKMCPSTTPAAWAAVPPGCGRAAARLAPRSASHGRPT
jgi:hypothetical protein